MKNIDKWNGIMRLVNERHGDFINAVLGSNRPEIIYQVYRHGKMETCYVTSIEYSQYENGLYYQGKYPTNEDIARIQKYYEENPPLKKEKIVFNYFHYWGDDGKQKASSAFFLLDPKPGYYELFTNKESAELASEIFTKEAEEEKQWRETHKKDKSFDYTAAGYKFLGWQNSWKHVYFDEAGNETTDPETRRTFGYTKKDYPEYGNCRELKHRTIDVSHNNRGSEHTVSCPECKIYWKYDSSD